MLFAAVTHVVVVVVVVVVVETLLTLKVAEPLIC
jgi:hypothetical protein